MTPANVLQAKVQEAEHNLILIETERMQQCNALLMVTSRLAAALGVMVGDTRIGSLANSDSMLHQFTECRAATHR